MVKIGVIFMPFSNPMCHFRDTADFTRLKTYHGKVSCISERARRIWKWHENDTYLHHHFYLKNGNGFLNHPNVEPQILAKIKIYILTTRAELLCRVCYEIPFSWLTECKWDFATRTIRIKSNKNIYSMSDR